MDFPVVERNEKLSALAPLTSNLDKKIRDFLFMPKELVWLIHELKSFNIKLKTKKNKAKTQNTNTKSRGD